MPTKKVKNKNFFNLANITPKEALRVLKENKKEAKAKVIPLTVGFDPSEVIGKLQIFDGAKITMNDVISFEVSEKNELLSVSVVNGKSYCGFLKNRNKTYGKQNWNRRLK